jgi:superfamily II DNA or RNA helicase
LKHFPADIQFKYPWRTYQKRVLTELEEHLEDDHLHIIAPPGSGKTVLGLEVARRLNKPTLVFAPTLAIRNQWIQRFCELFLQETQEPKWISRDIKNPGFLTVTTYQALHMACSGLDLKEDFPEEEDEASLEDTRSKRKESQALLNQLKKAQIGTLVVDEAHHLKNAWWESLTRVKEALNPTIVGLTATPPYDVSYNEWQRYLELNGPVDTEISVPELIIEEDLCPHQDYIYFSTPTDTEGEKIRSYRARMEKLFQQLQEDRKLITALRTNSMYTEPEEHLEWIYTHLEFYSSVLIYLHATGTEVSEDHLDIIGNTNIPPLNFEWMQILLRGYLFDEAALYPEWEEHQEKLIHQLRRGGALHRRTIDFGHSQSITKSLSTSLSKLDSIEEIVDFEYEQLSTDLRGVVLTDFIRKEYLLDQPTNTLPIQKMGVVPIFEKLRRKTTKPKLGILTGSLIVIPVDAFSALKDIAALYSQEEIRIKPLPYDPNYLQVYTSESLKTDLVHVITRIFEAGHIELLIGTKSLLGEGWDAPSINTLILASFVGSYVLSNQMRGRAIRTHKENQEKTGNIWHLACVDPSQEDGGDDVNILKRRFQSFVGVSLKEYKSIENGIHRFDLPKSLQTTEEISAVNQRMKQAAAQRDELKSKWQQALEQGGVLVEEVKVPFPPNRNYRQTLDLHYRQTIVYMIAALSALASIWVEAVGHTIGRVFGRAKTAEEATIILLFILISAALFMGRRAYKTLRLYLKYRDISKDIHAIADALLQSLQHQGVVKTEEDKLQVKATVDELGTIYCHLEGASTFEKSAFIACLQEIISPVENPRYLIIRKSFFANLIAQRDFHAVPEILGRKKKTAVQFEDHWRDHVGRCELVYTRTIKGRKLLLKSRLESLSAQFQAKSERINTWR